MRVPDVWDVANLTKDAVAYSTAPDGTWRPARPLGHASLSLRRRVVVAWRVFTGRYDALKWKGDES